jgi:DNA-directed RNA polymerase specialized sigma24 family protein
MTTIELNLHYLTYINDSCEDNYHSLLQACRTVAKQQLSLASVGEYRDDLADDCVIAVMDSLSSLRPGTDFSFWYLKVIYNEKMTYLKKRSRTKEEEFTENTVGAADGEYNFAHERLREAAGKNYPLVQDLLMGLTFDEAATKHGITKKAIQNRLSRIREKAAKNVQ